MSQFIRTLVAFLAPTLLIASVYHWFTGEGVRALYEVGIAILLSGIAAVTKLKRKGER